MYRRLSSAALIGVFVVGCISADDPNRKTKQGAAVGAAAGAIAGAIVGNQSGNARTGAVVGAAAGAGIGAVAGRRMDNQQKELEQIEGVEVTRTAEDELNVVLKNDILFDVDSAALRTESRSTLRDMGEVFARYTDTTISIEGHADSQGADKHNLRLSERRAEGVRNYLVGQGLAASRVRARGYGESQPKASNDTPEGRQLNRRVEIQVKARPE